jgi:hypothetical protein
MLGQRVGGLWCVSLSSVDIGCAYLLIWVGVRPQKPQASFCQASSGTISSKNSRLSSSTIRLSYDAQQATYEDEHRPQR